jgi:hypothetical protein
MLTFKKTFIFVLIHGKLRFQFIGNFQNDIRSENQLSRKQKKNEGKKTCWQIHYFNLDLFFPKDSL